MSSVTIRIDNPRRAHPTLRVFIDFDLRCETDIYREDAQRITEHLVAHADDIEHAAYPSAAIRRLIAEATR